MGSMLISKEMLGPQKCILECSKSVVGCLSINYNFVDLICEFNGEDVADNTRQTEFVDDADYYFVRMGTSQVSINVCLE